jgi:PleD family two-component response regulator
MREGAIWICAETFEDGRHIKKVFDEANLLNPVEVVENAFDYSAFFESGTNLPLIVLLDLGMPYNRAWNILSAARGTIADEKVCFIGLIEDSTETLLDRAYDAGVKSYLRKPLTFVQFLERARLLNVEFVIGRRVRS